MQFPVCSCDSGFTGKEQRDHEQADKLADEKVNPSPLEYEREREGERADKHKWPNNFFESWRSFLHNVEISGR